MRKQRAFATLTEGEIQLVAQWVRAGKYDDVIVRVAKPRPEGFGIKISRKPLQLLHAKSYRLDKINARITTGEKLTFADLDAIHAGEKIEFTEEAHAAILGAAHDLATSGDNNPTQLLALQRLVDFPDRVEIREERLELDRQKHALRADLAEHRKRIDNERLDLEKRRVAIAEANAKAKPLDHKQEEADELGPIAHDWEGVRARAQKAFNITPEESARRAALRKLRQHQHQVEPQNSTDKPASTTGAPAAAANIIGILTDLATAPELNATPETSEIPNLHFSISNSQLNTFSDPNRSANNHQLTRDQSLIPNP
jgi:hypothetical protein